MRLKPSFAKKLNQDGYSPMHLALEWGQTKLFHRFLDVDRSLVRVPGKEGKTSLHYVAEKGDPDLLSAVLKACPESIIDLTTTKENALHVAVKNNRFENLKVLLTWLQYVGQKEIAKWTDTNGNTLLHIAILSRSHDTRMVQLLINRVRINALNLAGKTALDILLSEDESERPPGLEELLRNAGARDKPTHRKEETLNPLKKGKVSFRESMELRFLRRKHGWSTKESRNAILVVAVLIATATYQAALSPSQIVEPDYQQSSNSILITAANVTTGAVNATTDAVNNATSAEDSWDHLFPKGLWPPLFSVIVLSPLFQSYNLVAFHFSMQEIQKHLPPDTATPVYPLYMCFMLLMAIRSPVLLFISLLLVIMSSAASLFCPGYPPSRTSLNFARASILKHYRSFEKEMKRCNIIDGM